MANNNGPMGCTGVVSIPSGPTGPTGFYGPMGCPTGPVGATGVPGHPSTPSKYTIINYRLVMKNEKELNFYVSWINTYDLSNLLYIQTSAPMFQTFVLTSELPLNHYSEMNIHFSIPISLHKQINHKLTSLFNKHEFLDFEEIKKNIDKINNDYATECFRNIMYVYNINMKISLEQALDIVKEHFIEPIHDS